MPNEIQQAELNILKEVVALFEKHDLHYSLYCGTLLGAVRHQGFIPWDDDVDLAMPVTDYRKFLRLAGELTPRYGILHTDNSRYFLKKWAKVYDRQATPTSEGSDIFIDIYPLIGAFPGRVGHKLQMILFRSALAMRLADKKILLSKPGNMKNRTYHFLKFLSVFPFSLRNAVSRLFRRIAMPNREKYKKNGTLDAAPFEGKFKTEYWKDMILLPFEGSWFKAPSDYDTILKIMYGNYMILPPEFMRRPPHNEQ